MKRGKRPDANDIGREQGPEGLRSAFDNAKRSNGAGQRERFKLVRAQDYTYDPTAEEWLIQGLLPARGLAVLYAKWKSFKSFFALNIAVAVADRPAWAGRKVKNGVVIYIVCEGQGIGFRKRVAAYGDLSGVDLYLIEARPNLGMRPGDVAELVKAIAGQLPADGGDPVLIIIDTLARTLHGRDENGEGMQNFIDNGEDLADAFECLTLAVHHEGAGDTGRMRGYSMADAASVATWRLKRTKTGDKLGAILTVLEAKDSVSDLDFAVQFKRIELGDEHAEHCESTLIVDTIEPTEAASDKPRASVAPSEHAFMTAFDQALDRHGIELHLPDNGPRVKAVNNDYLRATYYQRRADLDADGKRRTFNRHLGNLIEREVLVSREINGTSLAWRAKRDSHS
jgi:AAA domain